MGKRILFSVLGFAAVLVIGFVVRAVIAEATGDLSTAEVGDCINQAEDIDDARVVDCDSEDAVMRVFLKNPDWTENEFERVLRGEVPVEELCDGQPIPPGGDAIWYGEDKTDGSGNGDIFCVEPLAASS